jgi:hypothetical protein
MSTPAQPLRYDFEVPPNGRIEVQLPFPAGTQVTVLVVDHSEAESDDTLAAIEALKDSTGDVLYEDFRSELGL